MTVVLERGCVYIVRLQERLKLPAGTSAMANPKSSTGRLDIFTRLITDGAREFESVADGYEGPLYAEISPRTFSVLVRPGSRLSQLRLRRGVSAPSDHVMESLQSTVGLVHGAERTDIRNGVALSVNLDPDSKSGVVGWRARKHAGLIDVDAPASQPVDAFWERVASADLTAGGLVLNPDEFYILASREFVTVPKNHAAEMRAYDTRVGEFRAHYAGFFDPGLHEVGANALVRKCVRTRTILIDQGQTVPAGMSDTGSPADAVEQLDRTINLKAFALPNIIKISDDPCNKASDCLGTLTFQGNSKISQGLGAATPFEATNTIIALVV